MASNHQKYRFKVVAAKPSPGWEANMVFLIEDGWDDGFIYSTMYNIVACVENSEKKRVGTIKIGQFDMKSGQRRPALPQEFTSLDERFFSLGQDADYYEELNTLGDEERDDVLASLNDIAADSELWIRTQDLDVTRISILRGISRTEVEGQFRRLTQGGVRLTKFDFTYTGPKRDVKSDVGLQLSFRVEPESLPPSNVHVMIGRNGVGKSHTMNLMVKALIAKRSVAAQSGNFVTTLEGGYGAGAPFSNLVSVCFSAFDSFLLGPTEIDENSQMAFSYIGLRRLDEEGKKVLAPKSPERLATEFVKSVIECSVGKRTERWQRALETLESDPVFAAADVKRFIEGLKKKERQEEVKKLFARLSSGHQIVLLSITKLVETVEEKTLVLLDEPEGHLHPPLLSAFVRALSDLLIDRNGVAIIATHSPVVLQEVPQNCVWKLQRSGAVAIAERPDCQTFGENVGILTREVFGFEVTDSGFHRMLRDVAETVPTFDLAVRRFKGELGAEARAMLRVMYLRKEASHEEPE